MQGVSCVSILEEIVELFVVDLEEGAVGGNFETLGANGCVELGNTTWDDTLLLLEELEGRRV